MDKLIESESDCSTSNFTMLYHDAALEKEYQLYHHTFVMKFGKVIMAEVCLVNLFDIGMALMTYQNGEYDW